ACARRGWGGTRLYGGGSRAAGRARARAACRRARETRGSEMSAAKGPEEVALRESQPIVHEELQRLPEKYRAPLLLCYFQGKTSAEAARLLGWPVGTVKGRLNRARALLRGRLLRRGLAPATAGLAAF